MEEEGEEPERPTTSDLGGVPWKEAVELHAKLKGDSEAGSCGEDVRQRDSVMEEEDDEDESSDGKFNSRNVEQKRGEEEDTFLPVVVILIANLIILFTRCVLVCIVCHTVYIPVL